MQSFLSYSFIGASAIYLSYYIFGKAKRYVYSYILNEVKKELDRRMEQYEAIREKERIEEEDHCKPFHNNSILIKVKHEGRTDSVYIPFNEEKIGAMQTKKVYLLKGDQRIDISQKPGIPYLVSADQLGGEKIVVEDLSGDVIQIFGRDKVPNF